MSEEETWLRLVWAGGYEIGPRSFSAEQNVARYAPGGFLLRLDSACCIVGTEKWYILVGPEMKFPWDQYF